MDNPRVAAVCFVKEGFSKCWKIEMGGTIFKDCKVVMLLCIQKVHVDFMQQCYTKIRFTSAAYSMMQEMFRDVVPIPPSVAKPVSSCLLLVSSVSWSAPNTL